MREKNAESQKQHGKFKLREVAWCSGKMDSNKVGKNDMKMINTISEKGEGQSLAACQQ